MITIENVLHNDVEFCNRLDFSLETYSDVKSYKNLLTILENISCNIVKNSHTIIELLLKNVVPLTTIGVLDYDISDARKLEVSISNLNDSQFNKVIDKILNQ